MTTAAVELDRVWKRYYRGGLPSYLFGLLHAWRGSEEPPGAFWALKELSLSVRAGETLGIIGRNGSGKTTVLKLISRVSVPTKGWVRTRGRIGALINLGAGFHRELTGRENIFLKGVIMGMTRREVARKLDEIIAFSGLGAFIDTPVKRYSTGMYARLGFSVAAHLDPDILLVDEVLSVGDIEFQNKSMNRMLSLRSQQRAIVFVSHNLAAVEALCDRVAWLDNGQCVMVGESREVIAAYLDDFERCLVTLGAQDLVREDIGTGEVLFERVEVCDREGRPTDEFAPGEEIVVRLHYRAAKKILRPLFNVGIGDGSGRSVLGASMILDGHAPDSIEGVGVVGCRFHDTRLRHGVYQVGASVRDSAGFVDLLRWRWWRTFWVKSSSVEGGVLALSHRSAYPIACPYTWEVGPSSPLVPSTTGREGLTE